MPKKAKKTVKNGFRILYANEELFWKLDKIFQEMKGKKLFRTKNEMLDILLELLEQNKNNKNFINELKKIKLNKIIEQENLKIA